MRKLLIPLAVLGALLMLPGTAAAQRPSANCPNGASGYSVVNQQQWWDRTVAGFEAEGIHVYEPGSTNFTDEFNDFAAGVGFGDGQGLYDFIWGEQWDGIDKNHNWLVCMKARPHTPGNPAFFFNGVDDTAH